jgi:hypothetical protein
MERSFDKMTHECIYSFILGEVARNRLRALNLKVN